MARMLFSICSNLALSAMSSPRYSSASSQDWKGSSSPLTLASAARWSTSSDSSDSGTFPVSARTL